MYIAVPEVYMYISYFEKDILVYRNKICHHMNKPKYTCAIYESMCMNSKLLILK